MAQLGIRQSTLVLEATCNLDIRRQANQHLQNLNASNSKRNPFGHRPQFLNDNCIVGLHDCVHERIHRNVESARGRKCRRTLPCKHENRRVMKPMQKINWLVSDDQECRVSEFHQF